MNKFPHTTAFICDAEKVKFTWGEKKFKDELRELLKIAKEHEQFGEIRKIVKDLAKNMK